ncbi:MAG TPA: DUF6285 domain-containing protein [Stellaceae bacterium]|jgi:hypothetical protein
MRDLPTGLDLLALARRLLLDEILPLLPEERRPDLRLAATSMAIAAREAANGEAPLAEIGAMLEELYGEPADPARLAGDLRKGAFETSGSRETAARAILWRLTILKLREGNPQFLAAHGIE